MKNITAQCIHCQREVTPDSRGGWVDPEATGDDVMWSETCDAHDTFTAEHEVATGTGETVTTWCDGFGVWHARVNLPGIGYGDYLGSQWDRIRAKARRAIRRELMARGELMAGYAVRIQVVASHQHPGALTTTSVTFAEV